MSSLLVLPLLCDAEELGRMGGIKPHTAAPPFSNSNEEVTIQHMVPISDVRLWCDHYPDYSPIRQRV